MQQQNQSKRSVELEMELPDECRGCGWKPSDDDPDLWAAITQAGPFLLIACPKCSNVMVNKNWKVNIEQIENAMDNRIVIPEMRMR